MEAIIFCAIFIGTLNVYFLMIRPVLDRLGWI
jgi:hypothetical protein